ncbi:MULTISPECIES: hypothetical protein [unclassified Agrobacterium]|uniref:hypothetical protein n=1 Tax=unclassified Agrobacterium TaxID=2632611 RepID=UPI002446C073|nr:MULTISPECIES: hypothetical protein [unclassified Agrobacterium]MDH0617025.1 hypothetical protein [Agrobacterium sp. GD03872]MDH0699783.1 hypothetical protein [Agrobacterium sp. GD03871]MDH1061023.1 hypothetical protein [Agrobacterium sp. GD03992]MDH2211561.1 hypothetical protein [Agrobacterium sp. GD03643]MDH2221192.1 hypothetical protein [Agrobacterium sp. GD03638]
MEVTINPLAPEHLPGFFSAPGETDTAMVFMAIILVVAVLAFGLVFLRIHTLPERMAHKGHKLQFEIVAVLGLLALFTHIHLFWVIGLLLAFIDIPDFGGAFGRMAHALEKLAGIPQDTKADDDTSHNIVPTTEVTASSPVVAETTVLPPRSNA